LSILAAFTRNSAATTLYLATILATTASPQAPAPPKAPRTTSEQVATFETSVTVLRSGMKWGHFTVNPARGVEMPRLRTVRPKWALTVPQATALLGQLPWLLPRTLVGLALLTALRRGELFALRWRDLD